MNADLPTRRILGVPPTVFLVGIVSMLMDVSSEMLIPIMPIFITAVLGGSAITLGLIEGLAESTASLLKVYSGRKSDQGARKPWVVAGYGLSALSKPLLALSGGWGQLLAARLVDRTGKGLRSAPRDAIIAAATPPAELGRAFGVHRGMDTLGAAIGPLIAFACLPLLGYRGVFWLSAIPAALAVVVLVLFVKEGAQEIRARRDALRVPFPQRRPADHLSGGSHAVRAGQQQRRLPAAADPGPGREGTDPPAGVLRLQRGLRGGQRPRRNHR